MSGHRLHGNTIGYSFWIFIAFYQLEVPRYAHSMEVRSKYYSFCVSRLQILGFTEAVLQIFVRFFLLTKCIKCLHGTEMSAIRPHVNSVELLDTFQLYFMSQIFSETFSAGIFDLGLTRFFFMDPEWSCRSCAWLDISTALWMKIEVFLEYDAVTVCNYQFFLWTATRMEAENSSERSSRTASYTIRLKSCMYFPLK